MLQFRYCKYRIKVLICVFIQLVVLCLSSVRNPSKLQMIQEIRSYQISSIPLPPNSMQFLSAALVKKESNVACNIIRNLDLSNLQRPFYSICKICCETNRIEYATSLIKAIEVNKLSMIKEYDIIPYLLVCSSKRMIKSAYELIKYLESQNIEITAKSYSILLQGEQLFIIILYYNDILFRFRKT